MIRYFAWAFAAAGCLILLAFAIAVAVWPFVAFGWHGLWLYLLLSLVLGVAYSPFALIDLWFSRRNR